MKKYLEIVAKFLKKINLKNEVLQRVLACIAYIPGLIIISACFMKKSTLVSFHVRQGLVMLMIEAFTIITFFVPALPVLFILLLVVLMIIGIINAGLGRKNTLPMFGKVFAK